jgi:hypothetical protein
VRSQKTSTQPKDKYAAKRQVRSQKTSAQSKDKCAAKRQVRSQKTSTQSKDKYVRKNAEMPRGHLHNDVLTDALI